MALLRRPLRVAVQAFSPGIFTRQKNLHGRHGSMFLGGAVAAAAYGLRTELLIFFGVVYLAEAGSVMLQVAYFKLTHGKRIFKMSPIHHHFELSGWNEVKIVYVFSFVALTGVVLGACISIFPENRRLERGWLNAATSKKRTRAGKKRTARPPLDWPLLIIVLTLVGFGLVMLFSASYPAGYYRFGDSYEFIRPQMFYAAVGIIAMFVISHIDYHILHRFALPLMALSITLLVLVLIIGSEYNGAKRWINLGFGTLQPSGDCQFAVIALFAHIISLNHDKMKTFRYGVLPFLLVLGTIAGLMLLEPHLSGTVIILGIGAIMMFVGGTGACVVWPWHWSWRRGHCGRRALCRTLPYAMTRIEMWQDPLTDPNGYQTVQSFSAIASGGLTGLGDWKLQTKALVCARTV